MRPRWPFSFWRQIWNTSFICSFPSFVAPLGRMHVVEVQRLLVHRFGLIVAGVLPCRDVREAVVIAERFAIGSLVLFTEVPAAGLLAVERVDAHQLAEFQEIRHTA